VVTRPPPSLRFGRGKAQSALITQRLPDESGQAIHADVVCKIKIIKSKIYKHEKQVIFLLIDTYNDFIFL